MRAEGGEEGRGGETRRGCGSRSGRQEGSAVLTQDRQQYGHGYEGLSVRRVTHVRATTSFPAQSVPKYRLSGARNCSVNEAKYRYIAESQAESVRAPSTFA